MNVRGGNGLCGIAFSPEGTLFACSTRDARLLFLENKELVKYTITDGAPTGIAFDNNGTILVADAAHCAVLEIESNGVPRVVLHEFERVALRVSDFFCAHLPLIA